MSASMKHRAGGYRPGDRKSHKNKTETHHAPEKSPVESYKPWAPSAYTAFKALLSARLCAAMWCHVTDCDETYNYWEPLHYLIHGQGFQTWEYSPTYAIRSYAYLWLYGLPLKLYVTLAQGHSMLEFYFLRTLMAFTCALCEVFLYRSVCRCLGNNTGRVLLCLQLFSTGMYISSAAFLPSSFSMYMTMLAIGAWFIKLYPLAIFSIAASAILGWPFAGALGIPIAFDLIVRKKKILMFIGWSLISAVICLVPVVIVDSHYYGKIVVAPLNIVLYNVFSNHGPDIYGVEPWSFYFVNGFLNYNLVFVLALASLPFVVLTTYIVNFLQIKFSTTSKLPIWLALSPMYIWILIFFTRPHKEERFLFPIYPLFSLAAAVVIDHTQKLLHSAQSMRRVHYKYYTQSRTSLVVSLGFCLLVMTVSFSRSLALYKGYHAPMDVYSELTRIASDPNIHELPESRQVNVCVGKEWYRFPSSFFLPDDRWRLQFLKSEFRGQLPKPYADWPNGTRLIPSHMNDRNVEEPTRYVDVSRCHYLIDLDLPEETKYEPRYSEHKQHWNVIASVDFLDTQRSDKFFRAFYVPFLSEQHCVYTKYNLLQSKSYKDKS